ncbi:hypothetical protein PILCRDRAFT_820550 [Piloderma croceum F 1598]|uniref:Uncharacterized protein n=1 Tax=Piloderma croceum (strain F 1598) TaxID=765440 RepID=A0A0C3FC47_PILCF|nr:hypothetical protein PILCRDRAFT_820550 [Piloderma croceum F 1598]
MTVCNCIYTLNHKLHYTLGPAITGGCFFSHSTIASTHLICTFGLRSYLPFTHLHFVASLSARLRFGIHVPAL